MNSVSSPKPRLKSSAANQYFSLIFFSGLRACSKDDMVLSAVGHYIVKCSSSGKAIKRREYRCMARPEGAFRARCRVEGAGRRRPGPRDDAPERSTDSADGRGRATTLAERSTDSAASCLSPHNQVAKDYTEKQGGNKTVIKAVISEARGRVELKKRHTKQRYRPSLKSGNDPNIHQGMNEQSVYPCVGILFSHKKK